MNYRLAWIVVLSLVIFFAPKLYAKATDHSNQPISDPEGLKKQLGKASSLLNSHIEVAEDVLATNHNQLAKEPILIEALTTQIEVDKRLLKTLNELHDFLEANDKAGTYKHPDFDEPLDYGQMLINYSIDVVNLLEIYTKRVDNLQAICEANHLNKDTGEGLVEELYRMSDSRIPYLAAILDSPVMNGDDKSR